MKGVFIDIFMTDVDVYDCLMNKWSDTRYSFSILSKWVLDIPLSNLLIVRGSLLISYRLIKSL